MRDSPALPPSHSLADEEVEVATTMNGAFVASPFIIWFYN